MEAIRIVHWERERVVTRASRTTNGQHGWLVPVVASRLW